MNQFYPGAVCDMALNRANEGGGLVTPPEEDFDTDAMRGSMQQMLSDNLGLYVVCEFLMGTQAMSRKEWDAFCAKIEKNGFFVENTMRILAK